MSSARRSIPISHKMELTPEMEAGKVHLEEERRWMGERRVFVHLLVPTQLGMHSLELKKENMWREECSLCAHEMEARQQSHQLWCRIMGGTADPATWEYAISFEPVCQRCRSSNIPRYGLLVLRREHLAPLADFVDEHAFRGRRVDVENFLDTDSLNALVDNYLWRLTLINSLVPQCCAHLFGKRACFYCGDEGSVCRECKGLVYCERCAAQHPPVCGALKNGRLFQTDPASDCILLVERTIEGRAVRYRP